MNILDVLIRAIDNVKFSMRLEPGDAKKCRLVIIPKTLNKDYKTLSPILIEFDSYEELNNINLEQVSKAFTELNNRVIKIEAFNKTLEEKKAKDALAKKEKEEKAKQETEAKKILKQVEEMSEKEGENKAHDYLVKQLDKNNSEKLKEKLAELKKKVSPSGLFDNFDEESEPKETTRSNSFRDIDEERIAIIEEERDRKRNLNNNSPWI